LVEHCSAAFTATVAAGSDTEYICDTLDDIAQADIFVEDESRQAHSVRPALTLNQMRAVFLFSFIHLPNPFNLDSLGF